MVDETSWPAMYQSQALLPGSSFQQDILLDQQSKDGMRPLVVFG